VAADAPLLGVVRRGHGLSSRAHRVDVAYLALAVVDLAGPVTGGPKTGDDRRRPVMVLSARADEGRADLSADLAVALAQHGEQVYLGDVLGAGDQLRSRVLATVAARWGSAYLTTTHATPLDTVRLPTIADDLADLTDTAQLPVVSLAGTGTEDRVRAAVTVAEPTPRRIVIANNGSRGDDTLTRDPIPVIAVGEGSVAVGPADAADPARLVLLDAPPTEFDPRGPGALKDGLAVLVVARDRTRISELRRAAERLRAAGHEPAGVVLIGGHRD
ncbi:MAG: hypothetical protein WCA46_20575, partial [Actinocatenispora sp.]